MKVEHTPGPWEVFEVESRTGRRHIFIDQAGEKSAPYLAVIDHSSAGISLKEAQANARLIAAAPELLDGGNDLHAALYDLRKAYAAVQEHHGLKAEDSPFIRAADAAMKTWVAAIAKAQGGAA